MPCTLVCTAHLSLARRLARAAAVLAVVWVCAAAAQAPSYYFTRINGQTAGLAQNSVHVLFQDRQGFVWIGTEGGLNRFDGYSLERHIHRPDHTDGLPSGLAVALTDGDEGTLWVGLHDGRLLQYDPRKKRVLRALDGLSGRRLQTLFMDGEHRLWVGTDAGVWRHDPGRPGLHQVLPSAADAAAAAGLVVQGFAQCPDGALYTATSRGLLALRADGSRLLGTLGSANGLFCSSDNSLFVTTNNQVLRVDRGSGVATVLWQPSADESGMVQDIAGDPEGDLWVSVHALGLLKLSPDGQHSLLLQPRAGQPDSLPSTLFTRLLVDRSGLVWVGTAQHGVVHTPARGSAVSRIVNPSSAFGANNVCAVFEDAAGRVWIGTHGAGLQQYLPQTGAFVDWSAPLREGMDAPMFGLLAVNGMADATAGGLWLATGFGVAHFDPDKKALRQLDLDEPTDHPVAYEDVLVDKDGSLWLASDGEGLVHYRDGQGVLARYGTSDGLPDASIRAVLRDGNGRLWVGTNDGLALFDPAHNRFRAFPQQGARNDALAGRHVSALTLDGQQDLWVSTDAGVNKVLRVDQNGLHVQRFGLADGLPDSVAHCALIDNYGRVWVSSNLGISRIDPLAGTVRSLRLDDGLQGLEFNPNACLRDLGGNLWFGGLHGLNYINSARVVLSQRTAPTVITGVQVGQRHLVPTPGQVVMVPPRTHSVRIFFASLDYAAPASNRFRYRLLGSDDRWHVLGTEHAIAFTALPAGRYTFEVSGSNHDGLFNPSPARLMLEVRPPWWATTAARTTASLLLAALVLLVLLALYHRHVRVREHQRELRQRDKRLRLALWGSGDEFWDFDLRSRKLSRIAAGHPEHSEQPQTLDLEDWRNNHLHPDDLRRVYRAAIEHMEGQTDRFESEHRVRDRHGRWRWVRWRGQVVERDENNKPLRLAGTIHDLDKQMAAQQRERIASQVIESMVEAVAVTDLDFRFISINPAFTRMVGYRAEDLENVTTRILDCDRHAPGQYQRIRTRLREKGHWRGELWQRRKDGKAFLSWFEVNLVRGSGDHHGYYVHVMSDITERKRAEQELRYLANYDTLSGLPNRTLLYQRLGQAIKLARREGRNLALLFLDLDRFKQVNDTMGHAVGDQMLEAAGARLRAKVRKTDLVARLGGDEFCVLVSEVGEPQKLEELAQALVDGFDKPLHLADGREVLTSLSVGVALFPQHASSPSELLRFADTAMYQAKERGRRTWVMYNRSMEARARQHANMLGALQQAVANNELTLVFQPKLDIDTWRITGVEALLRWRNPEFGAVPPSVFIPLAEESGLINEIGAHVLFQACVTLGRWQRAGLDGVSMAVNLSSAQLLDPRLHEQIDHALAENGLQPQDLMLELTESQVMSRGKVSLGNLHRLKALGVSIAIDDFGTGYSSLSYLKSLPVDVIKIDQAFVGNITSDPDDEVITATIISIGHALDLDIVAEGVESFGQLAYLQEKRCDEIQGHWLSPPIEDEACLALIRAHDPASRPTFAELP